MGAVAIIAGPVAGRPQPADAASSNVNAPAANTAAVITFAAAAGVKHVLPQIFWSYDADPTGGRITVTDNGTTVFDENITNKGPGAFTFARPIKSAAANTALVVTLAAGGASVTGKVNTPGKWSE